MASSLFRSFFSSRPASLYRDIRPLCIDWSAKCKLDRWVVAMEKPDKASRDELIDLYIETLATVIGSKEKAKMQIYSVSTEHNFAFSARLSEELALKLRGLPKVRFVAPDSRMTAHMPTDGEPFVNGQAITYDDKYHGQWTTMRSGKR